MVPLLAALASGTAFALMQLVLKRHAAHSHPLLLPSLLGLLAPVWALLFIVTHATGTLTYNLTPGALLYPLLWALCTVTTTTILVWLLRSFSLTEVTGYKKALLTLGALGADITVFHQKFPAIKLAAIGLLLAGALGLSHTRSRMPTWREALVLLLWCGLMTAQITFYKEGLLQQPHVLSNSILAQFFSTVMYSAFNFMPGMRQLKRPPLSLTLPLLACALTGTLLEGFGYAGLTLAAVMLLTILPATLFAAHDLWRGELPRQFRTYGALGAIAAGFALLIFSRL